MTFSFSQKTKTELFNALKSERNAFLQSMEGRTILDFLGQIWDLQNLPSTDSRFKDAEGDIYQHIINNDDWDVDYVFLKRLNLLENNDKYALFIETLLMPENRESEDEIMKFVLLINPYIERDGYLLSLLEYDDLGRPIYKISPKDEVENLPTDIKVNKVPFYVYKNIGGKSQHLISHTPPKTFPSFVLVLNNNWNDYGDYTEFHLFFYAENKSPIVIGPLKIISSEAQPITSQISDKFTSLPEKFCSLGQNNSYYTTLKKNFEKDFESLLYSLRDVAFFAEIKEKFEKFPIYKTSLIRFDEAERIARQIKYQVYDYDLKNLYRFKYAFHPLYSETPIDVDFEFNGIGDVPNRIYAIIGKNGAGKTQLISSLPMKISQKRKESFYPKIPLFSKVIAVSYSIFDSFEIPRKTATFNYVYCGLRNEKRELITERGLVLRFHNSWKMIEGRQRIMQWRSILSNFIDEEILNEFLIPEEGINANSFKVSIEGFGKIRNKLSSGQSIVLYIITEIVAYINYDSLILYDEPETHLHPNAITQLMNTIYELVNEFQSYCIIGTHSPLIIREILSKNVFVLERVENSPSLRKINIESFGENITTLTEEVFGNKETSKQYKTIIQKLVDEGKSFDQIVELLESDQVPLSLNTRIYIKSIANENA